MSRYAQNTEAGSHRSFCPNCNAINHDNWPISICGQIVDGGCQECWEIEIDRKWWHAVKIVNKEFTDASFM